MQAEPQHLEALLEIQKIDLEAMQAKKKRIELPQRIEVMRLRKKREEISAKLDQVLELQAKAEADITVVEDEDRSLLEKQERAQELIDAAGSDFRKVESHSREMAAAEKRRTELAGKLEAQKAQIAKIKGIRAQLEGAIEASHAEEARLRTAFEGQDGELAQRIRELAASRAELASSIPADIVNLYERTSEKAGGVALGVLEGDVCGVCRTTIEGGRLIDLRSQAPLGVCPSCKRLLVIS